MALRARIWSLEIGFSDSAANARSIVCPGLPGKSMVNRANTVSTVLIRPKPQLRCMQKPPVASCVNGSTWRPSILPAAASFSNSSLIKASFLLHYGSTMPPLNVVNDQNPRQIAAEVLRQQRGGGSFIEDLLERALAGTRLPSVDRALCQELVYGVVRWQAALDWLIARKTDGREQKPGLQNLLRLGLYQIFWLNRIPDHAAVHETVELAKRNGFGSQTGFVNAVLRGYLREAEATQGRLAELKVSQPALGWSHPEWLVTRWQKNFGVEKTAQLLEWNNTPPKMFGRVNTLKFCSSRREEALISKSEISQSLLTSAATSELRDAGDLLAQWRGENVDYDFVRRGWLEDNLVFEFKSHPPLAALDSFRRGWFYVQDPSTLLAAGELGPLPGETILDFCAAPGGKTTFLAQLTNNQGRIVAQDISEERLRLIRENCTRLGATCV